MMVVPESVYVYAPPVTDVMVPNAGESEMVKLGFLILKQSGL